MRILKFGELYQITFLANFFPVNCYIVDEGEELTLIDAGLPFSSQGILETVKKIGKPLTKILLTHAHEDHVGALDRIKETLPKIQVYISERDARLMNGDKSVDAHESQRPIKGGVPKSMKTKPDILLHHTNEVGSLICFSSPGHTPGSMSFFHQQSNALIAGDAFQTRGGIAVAGKVNISFPFPAFGTWDKKTSIESAKLLIELNPQLLAVGHGNVLINPIERMKQAVLEAEKRSKEPVYK
ncbi:MBL fold metallo-hydrolase [Rossellomorea aquimaris]|uniref:MBL fold metallo-hydrolase n=1 Tax=Rossellomorea aquimaris TaxID=189382 RepID=UPI0007D045B2|nr:MBL fold metallo-hydrolase [Rossellomorea aquimaris]